MFIICIEKPVNSKGKAAGHKRKKTTVAKKERQSKKETYYAQSEYVLRR